jgi:hypothetical protein
MRFTFAISGCTTNAHDALKIIKQTIMSCYDKILQSIPGDAHSSFWFLFLKVSGFKFLVKFSSFCFGGDILLLIVDIGKEQTLLLWILQDLLQRSYSITSFVGIYSYCSSQLSFLCFKNKDWHVDNHFSCPDNPSIKIRISARPRY